jgi:CheY-like chemotaxis protein
VTTSTSSSAREAVAQQWRPRPVVEVIEDQLRGIDAWNRVRRAREQAEQAAQAAQHSREMRMDLARRMDVIRHQQAALVARTEEQLQASGSLLRERGPARAIVVHRNEWFTERVVGELRRAGLDVVARLENGADAVGVAIAEQPDLMLVEDKLPMISGEDVIREVLRYAPFTIIGAQVSADDGLGAVLEAGAHTAFTRRVPPLEVARELSQLVHA